MTVNCLRRNFDGRKWSLAGKWLSILAVTSWAAVLAKAGDCSTLLVGNKRVPYLSNRPLTTTNAAITRAIIVIHGGYRVPEEYYAPILVALVSHPDLAQRWRGRTLVLAPHFQERTEAAPGEHGWKGDW